MTLATTVSLLVVRGPAALAKTLTALDVLSDGRLLAVVGPGSSRPDYAAAGVPFDERWPRFDEAIPALRALLRGEPGPPDGRFYGLADVHVAPVRQEGPPVWVASWGSPAGLAGYAFTATAGWPRRTTPTPTASVHAWTPSAPCPTR
jgi:alkanesulfonate monooxygenase SsuD/methylene tetrahydromethanopterin reductase-like flavin-dependent oxidoreductase (luciferase family)